MNGSKHQTLRLATAQRYGNLSPVRLELDLSSRRVSLLDRRFDFVAFSVILADESTKIGIELPGFQHNLFAANSFDRNVSPPPSPALWRHLPAVDVWCLTSGRLLPARTRAFADLLAATLSGLPASPWA